MNVVRLTLSCILFDCHSHNFVWLILWTCWAFTDFDWVSIWFRCFSIKKIIKKTCDCMWNVWYHALKSEFSCGNHGGFESNIYFHSTLESGQISVIGLSSVIISSCVHIWKWSKFYFHSMLESLVWAEQCNPEMAFYHNGLIRKKTWIFILIRDSFEYLTAFEQMAFLLNRRASINYMMVFFFRNQSKIICKI